jgi:signal transduction histidine kinase
MGVSGSDTGSHARKAKRDNPTQDVETAALAPSALGRVGYSTRLERREDERGNARRALSRGHPVDRVDRTTGRENGSGSPQLRARLVALLVRPTAPPLWLGVVVAASVLVVETLVVYRLMRLAPENTFGAIFFLGILLVSAQWEFGLAATMTLASTLVYSYVHIAADGTVLPITADDLVAMITFLPIALLASILAGQARLRAIEADQRRRDAEASRDAIRLLADQQTALRRIATLVARAVSPSEVFSAVAGELASCLGVHHCALLRYEPDGAATVLAARDEPGSMKMPVGKRFTSQDESVAAMVLRTGHVARMDSHDVMGGRDAEYLRQLGLHGGVGAPIVVAGRIWGVAIVGSLTPEPLPPDTEARVGDFADLVATAIANAETRSQLTASRARIVAAADGARRRFERDLHDGAQQRLVSLGLELRMAEEVVPPELPAVREHISRAVTSVTGVLEDLQEISRGIHPAILSRGGLGPALKTLARRSAVPVELHLDFDRRLPDSLEVAAYYVVAEALANTAKHAQASTVKLSLEADDANVRLSIRDDGIGGADTRRGSGLIGLADRVEALGGQLQISSIYGSGTSLVATIPFEGS